MKTEAVAGCEELKLAATFAPPSDLGLCAEFRAPMSAAD